MVVLATADEFFFFEDGIYRINRCAPLRAYATNDTKSVRLCYRLGLKPDKKPEFAMCRRMEMCEVARQFSSQTPETCFRKISRNRCRNLSRSGCRVSAVFKRLELDIRTLSSDFLQTREKKLVLLPGKQLTVRSRAIPAEFHRTTTTAINQV